ncbi:TetR/AcrR family transcriptional regulator [Nocardia altamirensis]|uniref:TetR/AcrR family transcriptional regulator n=1 Tax=Nocardia altamirensis TaxID=472158 RepID=UPI0008402460|nr:TetR/AcrR family transcriptional regulator C-terminal domain-containing protein [Nocardia altamirensis]
MPRPRSLTQEDLSAAALAVIDRDGLAALTMRAVAKELGLATMGLYRYVADREALEILVVDRIFADIEATLPPEMPWRERISTLLQRMCAAVSKHPETVPLVLRHRQSTAASLGLIETMLSALTEGGFVGRDRLIAQRTLIAFLFGFLQNEHYASLAGPGTATMAHLAVEDYPLVAATAAQARTIPASEEFRDGLAVVLRGLAPRGHPRS